MSVMKAMWRRHLPLIVLWVTIINVLLLSLFVGNQPQLTVQVCVIQGENSGKVVVINDKDFDPAIYSRNLRDCE